MSIFPVSDLTSIGMVSDVSPTQNSISAFTVASGVRFENGKISRAPVFSSYASLTSQPRHMQHFTDNQGVDHFLMKDVNGFIYEENGDGSATNVSPTNYAGSASEQPVTSCLLSNVAYFNRPDGVPMYRPTASGGKFAYLSDFDSGWREGTMSGMFPANARVAALRSYNSRLIALGVQQGGQAFPNTVWFSDVADVSGQPVKNFANEPAKTMVSTTSGGGATPLAEMRGAIIDGHRLAGSFLIFSDQETWKMDPNGDVKSIFNFVRLHGAGIINTNSAVEVAGMLYVFGSKDIFVTDGGQMQSIAAGYVRDFIYSNISNLNRSQSFVFHSPSLNEIHFCFASNDPYARFPLRNGNIGANRAAVYNYNSKCWYLYDLPYVTHACLINTFNGPTFDQLNSVTFDEMTGSFNGMLDGSIDAVAYCSNSSVAPSAAPAAIRTFAPYSEGVTAGVVDRWATAPVLMIKSPVDGSSLNMIPGATALLTQSKRIASIYIKGQINPSAAPVYISLGVCDQQTDAPTYNDIPMYWSSTLAKLDYHKTGHYIGFKIEQDDYRDFQLTGMDIDMKVLGSRSR